MYNVTPLNTADSILDLFTVANDYSGNLLIGLLMIGIFFIILMALKRWGMVDALLASSFVCFILSSFLTFSKLLKFYYPITFLIILALTALYAYSTKNR